MVIHYETLHLLHFLTSLHSVIQSRCKRSKTSLEEERVLVSVEVGWKLVSRLRKLFLSMIQNTGLNKERLPMRMYSFKSFSQRELNVMNLKVLTELKKATKMKLWMLQKAKKLTLIGKVMRRKRNLFKVLQKIL